MAKKMKKQSPMMSPKLAAKMKKQAKTAGAMRTQKMMEPTKMKARRKSRMRKV